jgi:hypothetical protein
VNPADMATQAYEREPGWFPLIARPAPPAGLLTLRYMDGTYLNI